MNWQPTAILSGWFRASAGSVPACSTRPIVSQPGRARRARQAGVETTANAITCLLLTFSVAGFAADAPPPGLEPIAPSSPREFFNAGTQKLREQKLREAEAFLESVLASQREHLQSPALYNLGHVRFGQGTNELKKGPAAGPTLDRGHKAAEQTDEAIRSAEEALGGNDLQKLVGSYLRGRGTRKELNSAIKAVRQALETHSSALKKWQRASGDFKSAVELNPGDAEAQQNADTMDRLIAKLVDSLNQLQQSAAMLGDKKRDLGDKMKQLRGRIPEPDMPPGAAGDEEEEEDMPQGPKEGDKEGPAKEGEQMSISPEQAGWLLESFKLDSDRRLPMGQKDTADPKDRKKRPW